jgi:hypothetical protein
MDAVGMKRTITGAAGLALALAGCATQAAATTVSPAKLLTSGTQALAALKSSQVTGTFTIDGVGGSVLASILQNGDITGTLDIGASESPFVYAGGTTYFRQLATYVSSQFSSGLADIAANLKTQPWWRTPGSADAAEAIKLITPGGLQATLLSGRSHMTAKATKDESGRAATRLTDSTGSIYLAAASPHNILEITTPMNLLVGNFSNIDLVFNEFNAPVTVTIPTTSVTPDIASMPPYFYVVSVNFGVCNDTGCIGKAVIETQAGTGTGAVTLTITNPANKTLAKCTTTVKASYSAGTTATCRARGSGWANFWNNVGGTYSIEATVANPYYTFT